jgi:hypothetical protein
MATARDSHGSNAQIGAGLLFGAGATALGVFSASRPLVGAAVYAVAAVAAVGFWYVGDGTADTDFGEASPADSTLGLLGMSAAVVFPALVAADGLGHFEWTAFTAGIACTFAGVFVVYGVVSLGALFRKRDG